MRENFHAARWDEPLVMELGAPGRRGAIVAAAGDEAGAELVPESMRRAAPPDLPELSEHDVLRHYLHLAQETLGMLGVSLFGTCTVKYNPRVAEQLVARPQVAEVHPYQDPATIQGAARDRVPPGPDPARAVRHGPVRVPARRRRQRGLHPRLRHARLPRRRAASSRPAAR